MKFKHWKEAEKRVGELRTQIDAINTEITAAESEARNEDTAIERRDELIGGIQVKIATRDGLQAECDEAVRAMNELKGTEERQFGLLSTLTTSRVGARTEDVDTSIYETRSYELAWADYIRSGNDMAVRDLISTQNNESAGIMVPTTLVNKIEDTLRTGGRIMSLCSITSVKGITEHPIAKSRTNPAWHDETGSDKKIRKSIAITSVPLEPQFIAEILETTRKFECDSISAFWDWLNAELPDALKRTIDNEILWGAQNGKNGIRGILTNTDTMFVERLKGSALDFNTANEAVALLADGTENNVTVAMNKKTFLKNVMGLRGADGHPIYKAVMDSNTNRLVYLMGGYPLVFTSDLPDYDTAQDGKPYMLLGDFTAMKLNFPEGMAPRLIRDELTRKSDNIIEYLSEIYVGGNIIRPGCFVAVAK